MNALSHEFDLSPVRDLPATGKQRVDPAALAAQWEAIHEAAGAVGKLAQLGDEVATDEITQLPERAARLAPLQRELVVRGVDDLAAVMQPGLRALLALTARGQDTTSAALTLWREFHAARSSLLSLADQE